MSDSDRQQILDKRIEQLDSLTKRLLMTRLCVTATTFLNLTTLLLTLMNSRAILALLVLIGWTPLVIILLIYYAGLRSRAAVLFEELSEELQWFIGKSSVDTAKHAVTPPFKPDLKTRLVLRTYAKATDLLFVPGTYGPGIYLLINLAIPVLAHFGTRDDMYINEKTETARDAILSSAAQPIAQQVKKLLVAPVEQALKGDPSEIPEMIRRRVQGLDFILGFGSYYNKDIIRTYLETLTRYDFFRYIILLQPDNKLLGMVDARSLLAVLEDPGSGVSFQDFATLLNGSDADQRLLAQLPGFVPARDAVTEQSDKRDVLSRMEKSGRDWLPVVNSQGRLEGIVDSSRLTASMILDITNQLKAAQPQNSGSASNMPNKPARTIRTKSARYGVGGWGLRDADPSRPSTRSDP